MATEIYEQLLAAYSSLNYITELLSFKKFMVLPEGKLSLKGYYSPQSLKISLLEEVDAFMNKLEELSFFFIDDQLVGLRRLSYQRINKINIIKQEKAKNKNFTTDHFKYIKNLGRYSKTFAGNFLYC